MTKDRWISCSDRLPENGQRVLGVVPGNEVLLPGKARFELRDVLVLLTENFCGPAGADAHGRHFWSAKGPPTNTSRPSRIGCRCPKRRSRWPPRTPDGQESSN